MKIQYFAERGSAEIINTIGMDIDNVSSVVDQITQFSISSILQIIGGVVGLSLLDWKLATRNGKCLNSGLRINESL